MRGRPIMHGASVVRSQLALIALTKRKGDIYGRVHVFPHTLRSIFGRAANPEFLLRFSYVVVRAVRYASLYRLLPRTSGLGCVPIIPDTWISLIPHRFSEDFTSPPRFLTRAPPRQALTRHPDPLFPFSPRGIPRFPLFPATLDPADS